MLHGFPFAQTLLSVGVVGYGAPVYEMALLQALYPGDEHECQGEETPDHEPLEVENREVADPSRVTDRWLPCHERHNSQYDKVKPRQDCCYGRHEHAKFE